MEDRDRIVNHLESRLSQLDSFYAFWIEGSVPQGQADELSDLDLWISTDDDKIFTIYEQIEPILSEISPIDFKYTFKKSGDLGHNVYHLQGMSQFLTIDINTQGSSRSVYLTEGIDDAEIIFDKRDVVKFQRRQIAGVDLEIERDDLRGFYQQMRPNVIKNIRRGKALEALSYYHQILARATKFLRLRRGWAEKVDFDLKHVYRDLSENETAKLEYFYDKGLGDLENCLPELEDWINAL
ncbi:hypothetical protein CR969_01715 [Candidatus Saccharibacteria bacterium]|nr:MAG: hypothetical protein CR969_01715 [Candidatus Saccharibacteria bacterium]